MNPGKRTRAITALHGLMLSALLSFGIALLAQAEPPPLSAYGQLPGFEMPTVSPSGKRLAMVITHEDKRLLVVTDYVEKRPLLNVPIGDTKLRNIWWAGDDLLVGQVTSTQNLGYRYGFKNEITNVFVADLDKKSIDWPLSNRGTLNASFGTYRPFLHDGHWQLCLDTLPVDHRSGSQSIGENLELKCRQMPDGPLRRVAIGGEDTRGWLIDGNGEVVAHETYDDRRDHWAVFPGKAFSDPIISLDGKDDVGLIGLGRSPDRLAYVRKTDEGDTEMVEMPLTGGEVTVLAPDSVGTTEPLIDPYSGLLIGYRDKSADGPEHYFDARLQARIKGTRKAFPGLQVELISRSQDFSQLVVHTAGPQDAGTFWMVDITRGAAEELGWDYFEVRRDAVGPWSTYRYQAADGLAIDAILTLPPDREAKDLPLVVMPHGGPEAHDEPQFDWWAQAYASRGYAVLQPNFRGSDDRSLDFRDAGYGEWGRKMQTDLSDGVAVLAAEGVIDPARVCIVGASYGGYAALAGVTVQQNQYRCAVSYGGVAAPEDMLLEEIRDRSYGATRYWKRFMGVDGPGDKRFDEISPQRLAARADAPVLLIHGKDDTVVPLSQSRHMHSALKRADKPVELLELDGEDHWLSRTGTRLQVLEASVAFVEKHNPAGPLTAPVVAEVTAPLAADAAGSVAGE